VRYEASLGKKFSRPYLKKGLVKWLKVQALSSSPSTAKKKKKITKRARGVAQVVK
jgi:ribosomal protein S21